MFVNHFLHVKLHDKMELFHYNANNLQNIFDRLFLQLNNTEINYL